MDRIKLSDTIALIAIFSTIFLILSLIENHHIRARMKRTEMEIASYYSEQEACKKVRLRRWYNDANN